MRGASLAHRRHVVDGAPLLETLSVCHSADPNACAASRFTCAGLNVPLHDDLTRRSTHSTVNWAAVQLSLGMLMVMCEART